MLVLLLSLSANAMSLDEAVRGAIETSPVLDVAAAQVSQAEARVRQADAGLHPTATASAGFFLQNEVEFNIAEQMSEVLPEAMAELIDPSAVDPIVVQPGHQFAGSIEVTQPLVVVPVWKARKVAREGVVLAQDEAGAMEQQVTAIAVQAWYASSQVRVLVEDATRGVELAERLVEKGQALVTHGVAAPDQLLPFERALATARANLAMAQEARTTADGVLEQITGLPGGADAFEVPDSAPTLDTSLAAIDRPDLVAAASRVRAAEAAVALERSRYWPVVALQGGVTYLEPEPGFGDNLNWKVGVGAKVPLYQGSTRGRVSEAEARAQMARAGERASRDRAEVEVRGAHGELATAMASLAEREEAARFAAEAVTAAEKRLSGGSGSLLTLQQAQAEQLAADAQLTRARAQAARAYTGLELAMRGAP
ncbi:MAG: TolC family protein [Deltaproteobacteria bacterium]|nr:TolC family protein [Deltaproteobacteria bacterium]